MNQKVMNLNNNITDNIINGKIKLILINDVKYETLLLLTRYLFNI